MPTEALLDYLFESGVQVVALPSHSPREMVPYEFPTREECVGYLKAVAAVCEKGKKVAYYTLPRATKKGHRFDVALPE